MSIFRNLEEDAKNLLIFNMTIKNFETGDIIMEKLETASDCYAILLLMVQKKTNKFFF
jgi:hypothetical protein